MFRFSLPALFHLRILLTLVLLWAGSVQGAQVIESNLTEIGLGSRLEFLADAEHRLDIEAVRALPPQAWSQSQVEIPSFGFTQDTYWARFRLHNPLPEEQFLIIEIGYPLLDDIQFYQYRDNQLIRHLRAGDRLPFEQRAVKHRGFLFPVRLDPGQAYEFYLKVNSTSSLQLPIKLWRSDAFYERDQMALFGHGLYYGIVLVMGFYNFFLFLRVRDTTYLFYVFYVATFAVTQMSLTGFSYQFLWPNSPEWNERSIAVLTPAIVASAAIFLQRVLRLRESHAWFHNFFLVMTILSVITALASLVLPYQMMIKPSAALAIICCASALFVSYYIWLAQGREYAAYFSAAWTVFLFGVVGLALNKFGVIPRTFVTESSAQIGSAIEIILLSYALAERLQAANKQRYLAELTAREANERLLGIERQNTLVLEEKVKQRTEELENAVRTVEQLNLELTELSTTDQVTGARNRRYFDQTLDRELRRARRNQKSLSLILIDVDHFKVVNDTYGHPAGDDCLRRIAEAIAQQIRRPPDDVCRYGGEELAVILPETSLAGALHVAEKIRESISGLVFHAQGQTFRITVSLGVTCDCPEVEPTPECLIAEADQALYEAKRLGRNRVVQFSKSTDSNAANT